MKPEEPAKQATPPPAMDMTVVSGEYERVEKLREEMRSSGRSHSIDTSRKSRTTERFEERVKSREAVKALQEKRTTTPPGMSGKFSAAFNKFASTDDQTKRAASPLARAKSGSRKDSMSSSRSEGSERPMRSATPKSEAGSVSTSRSTEEPIKPTQVEKVRSAPAGDNNRPRSRYDPEPEKQEITPKPEEGSESPRQSRAQRHRVEKNKNFNMGIPGKKPSSSDILDRMAKFGESVDTPPKSHQTVTTKNPDTEKFERHTHRADQPAFDVDIQIRREPGSGSEGPAGNKTAAIRVSRDQVVVEEIDRSQPERRDEYMNVWDTEIPVNDRREKVR